MTTNWKHLGQVARQRRRALKLTQQGVADAGGPSVALLRQIENGRYSAEMHASLRAGLERALRWKEGSVDRVLEGGEPESAPLIDEWTEASERVASMPLAERLFGRWDSSFNDLIRTEDEYGRVRGIDRSAASDELLEVWRMWNDGLDGRPWTPPWMDRDEEFEQAYGPGAEPWKRAWWASQEMSDEPWVTLRMKQLDVADATEGHLTLAANKTDDLQQEPGAEEDPSDG